MRWIPVSLFWLINEWFKPAVLMVLDVVIKVLDLTLFFSSFFVDWFFICCFFIARPHNKVALQLIKSFSCLMSCWTFTRLRRLITCSCFFWGFSFQKFASPIFHLNCSRDEMLALTSSIYLLLLLLLLLLWKQLLLDFSLMGIKKFRQSAKRRKKKEKWRMEKEFLETSGERRRTASH